jgi:dynein heavy chain 1, cytosolic
MKGAHKFIRNDREQQQHDENDSRLIYDYERQWTEKAIDEVASKHFGNIDLNHALKRPILFSDWLAGNYTSIDEDELRQHIHGRLKV